MTHRILDFQTCWPWWHLDGEEHHHNRDAAVSAAKVFAVKEKKVTNEFRI